MSQFQQYYPQAQPLRAPISSQYYAPRQNVGRVQPTQHHPQIHDNQPKPPLHPLQQQRPAQASVQTVNEQAQAYQRMLTQRMQGQPVPQAPKHVGYAEQRTPHVAYSQQFAAYHQPQPSTYLNQVQRTNSYPLPDRAAVPAYPASSYPVQPAYSGAYHNQASVTPAAPHLLQSRAYSQPAPPHGQGLSTAPATASISTIVPTSNKHNPATNLRRTLPTPGPSTAATVPPPKIRPVSMPPQAQYPPAPWSFQSTSSLSNMIPQSSFPANSASLSKPSNSSIIPSARRSVSPVRRPLPSPTPGANTAHATATYDPRGIPRTTALQAVQPSSPIRSSQATGVNPTQSTPQNGILQSPSSIRRALPHSPTAPPDLNQVRLGANLANRQSVSQIVSKFSGSIPSQSPSSANASGKYMPVDSKSPVRSARNTAIMAHSSLHGATVPPLNSAGDGYLESLGSTTDDDEISPSDHDNEQNDDRERTPSPQYGIRDIPKRRTLALEPSVLPQKSEPSSPQYGIRDLPARSKSVLERKKTWEQSTKNRSSFVDSARALSSGSGYNASKEAPSNTAGLTANSRPLDPVQSSFTTPSRSPQPQTPLQENKLPMPTVRQPQPSRTERQPSWTLPSADLDKVHQQTHANGQRTSMAFRFATMSLEADEKSVSHPQQSQLWKSPSKPSSPSKVYQPEMKTPRAYKNLDLNLDDAPPPSLRRSPSPSRSSVTSSVPSIPTIRTPDDGQDFHVIHNGGVQVPKINLPDDSDYDDIRSVHSVQVRGPDIVISPKPMSPRNAVPMISLPDDTEDAEPPSLPAISIVVPSPQNPTVPLSPSMPIILDDLASSTSPSSPTKSSRSLPKPPTSSGSHSNSTVRPRGSGLVCGGCHQSIIGRIVSAMGIRWHPQCFKCCTCGELLEHVSSYEHGGKPYCHLDYHELFAPQCYHCKTPIIDERFITLDDPALGKRTYHEQHFFCAECGDPFLAPTIHVRSKPMQNEISIKGDGAFDIALDEDGEEVGFTVYKGHPYCEACHVRLRAPKCKQCKKSIRDGMRAVEALGGKWCFECFVCAGCQKPFEDPSFFQRDKKPFCEPCFSLILRNEV